ncbi:MAG: DUF3500 domain-containing protein [Saprospiraceae bacterium]
MKKSKIFRIVAWIFGILALLCLLLWLNRGSIMKGLATKYFTGLESEHLAQEFTGITTSSGLEKDLFSIQSTGVSTQVIQSAAETFLNSLHEGQKKKTLFDIQSEEWRKWSNVDNGIYKRQGISLKEMSDIQKEAAFSLLQTALSAKGLQLSKDIMKTDQRLKEIKNGNPDFDEELYFLSILGTPSENEPWGWQLDGHHLVINYFILGDQVVMTPTFMGAEPVVTKAGKYKGNTLFQDEQNIGLAFMKGLPLAFQKQATISEEKITNNNLTEAFRDNQIIDYTGLSVSKMDSTQQENLLALVAMYINNMREGHAKIKMEEVRTHLDNTWFAWVGGTSEDGVFYYRIHSPVVMIEFDHQSPVGVPSDSKGPSRNHIHTVVRTPNGNDYGKDLLRQHLEAHHDH